MTGIFFIAVLTGWMCAALWLTSWVTRRIKRNGVRLLTGCLMFVGLMVLPVIDEIIGGVQFRALCEKNAVMRIDEKRALDAVLTARLVPSEQGTGYLSIPVRIVPKTPLLIRESSYEFYLNGRDKPVVAYKTYSVKGGWLIRILGISEGDAPLTISPAYCAPSETPRMIFERFNITTTNWKWK